MDTDLAPSAIPATQQVSETYLWGPALWQDGRKNPTRPGCSLLMGLQEATEGGPSAWPLQHVGDPEARGAHVGREAVGDRPLSASLYCSLSL